MDNIDKKILVQLQVDSDRKLFELERSLGIPRTTIHNRIRKFKETGIIKHFKAVVDAEKMNLDVCAMIHIVVSNREGIHSISKKLEKIRNIEEIHIVSGVFDIIIKARFRNNRELSDFIFNDKSGLKVWDGILRTESMICLETIKENGVFT